MYRRPSSVRQPRSCPVQVDYALDRRHPRSHFPRYVGLDLANGGPVVGVKLPDAMVELGEAGPVRAVQVVQGLGVVPAGELSPVVDAVEKLVDPGVLDPPGSGVAVLAGDAQGLGSDP